jgi:predicted chitinase
VDGGYIDNSGIDTALDLIAEIQKVAPGSDPGNIDAAAAAQLPPFRIYLVSLSSGDFPNRREYSLNEVIEPIRALLNGREARASIAHNRARNEFGRTGDLQELPRFNRTGLQSYYYDLPLGWAMSLKTREIIALDSGRFWDCEPNKDSFSQSDASLSNADCVQLQLYHLMNNSAKSALVGLAEADKTVKEIERLTASHPKAQPRVDHEAVLACYEQEWQRRHRKQWSAKHTRFEADYQKWRQRPISDARKPAPVSPGPFKQSYLSYYQAEHVRELLNEWDRLPNLTDPSILAYVLGSISYDSDDFRRTSDNLTYKSVDQIKKSAWRSRIERVNRDHANAVPPIPEVDLAKLANNPEMFAETVWGWNKNWFGNNFSTDGAWTPDAGEGWKYRSRGIYQIVGREQYDNESQWLKLGNPELVGMLPVDHPDVVHNRTMSAKIAFSHFSNWKQGPLRKTLLEVLATNPGDFKLARRNQNDMGDGEDGDEIVARTVVFQQCLANAKPKPSLDKTSSSGADQ